MWAFAWHSDEIDKNVCVYIYVSQTHHWHNFSDDPSLSSIYFCTEAYIFPQSAHLNLALSKAIHTQEKECTYWRLRSINGRNDIDMTM